MPKKLTTKVAPVTLTTNKVAGMTGMLLLASAAIGAILTLFVAQ